MVKTVREMKQDAVNLIYQVNDKNTDKMEKILLFLKASVVPNNSEEKLTREQNRRLSELESLCGIFEDALQYFSALQSGAYCIVTRNVKDFAFSEIEVLTPSDFLANYCPK